VLLLSVPYALKAADAEIIGGRQPSAFVLAAPPTANAANATDGSEAASVKPATSSDVTTTGGKVNAIPHWLALQLRWCARSPFGCAGGMAA
jgi:hypothetical protein